MYLRIYIERNNYFEIRKMDVCHCKHEDPISDNFLQREVGVGGQNYKWNYNDLYVALEMGQYHFLYFFMSS